MQRSKLWSFMGMGMGKVVGNRFSGASYYSVCSEMRRGDELVEP